MRPKALLFCFLFLLCIEPKAQDYKRTQNWYFGDSAGLSFATNPPTPLTDGSMSTVEGCATISDTNGNLLFYTNGVKVWNRNHQIMPNGSGLLGHESSTQAALIVPQPENDSLFYVFTTYAVGSGTNGFRYSIVNMSKNNGLGDVTVKNVFLQNPVCEKLTATKHANGKDIWVLAHGFETDLFFAYLVTTGGIVHCPVISQIGSVHSGAGSPAQGEMKFSFDGHFLAVCVYTSNELEVFTFNKSRGTIDALNYTLFVLRPFNIEFSQSLRYLYVTNRQNYLYQFDLSGADQGEINNSKIIIFTPPNTTDAFYTGIQIATDQRIYVALVDSVFIGRINYPDSAGAACSFELKAVNLSPNKSLYGLPNFVSSYFYKPSADFKYDLDCQTNSTIFMAKDTIGAMSYQWNITKTGTQTFLGNPLLYQFTDTGHYAIELLAINGTDTARQHKQIHIYPTYSLNLGRDTILCEEQNLILTAGLSQYCYMWNDSTTGPTLTVDTAGTYHVKVVSSGFCVYFDTIKVSFIQPGTSPILINRSADTLIATGNFHKYQWYGNNILVQDSSVSRFYLNKKKGTYKVIGTDSLFCFPVMSNDFIVDTLTGIVHLTKEGFLVYPNPVAEGQTLSVSSGQMRIDVVRLHSIEGKIVFEDNIGGNVKQYDLDHLKKGIYILNINQLYNYKIILK